MALDLIVGLGHGADKITVGAGAGATAPQVLSAVSTGPTTFTVTFDQAMTFIGTTSVLAVNKWSLVKSAGSVPFQILWIERQSDTVVILHTSQQEAVPYDVEVNDVEDIYLQPIDGANNDAAFVGTEPTFPTITGVTSFIGLDVGLQAEDQPDWEPDTTPPVVTNQNPAPSDTGVAGDLRLCL